VPYNEAKSANARCQAPVREKEGQLMPGRYHLYPFQVGECLVLKKKHPCGSDRWQVRRVGADIQVSCQKCGHAISIPRRQLEKAIKSIEPPEVQNGQVKPQ
jgi:hypothetical protein